jgi:uncharacterized protein involved in tolerance to divalent cations
MIKVTIEPTIREAYEVTENLVTKETPTGIVEESDSGYGGSKKKVQFEREFTPTTVAKTRERSVTLLSQEIENEERFNLPAVIAAINGLRLA